MPRIDLGDISVDVTLKKIKHVHLSVNPPAGSVRISAPSHMSLETIRVFAISKLGWIRDQRAKLRRQPRETPREYLERESHHLRGRRYLLSIVEQDARPEVLLRHSELVLKVRPGSDRDTLARVLAQWYREQLRAAVPELLARWQPALGVQCKRFFVQRMKTRWGSCNPKAGTIRLNSELAKKPAECLEYIVVHELVHLLEPSHNERFVALMDRHLPQWRELRTLLNAEPLVQESWVY